MASEKFVFPDALFCGDQGYGHTLVLCPDRRCELHYVHIESVEVEQNGFVVTVTEDGPGCSERKPTGSRGSLVTVNYNCECGTRFCHAFQFHKGMTLAEVLLTSSPKPGAEPVDVPELWRD